MVTSVSPARKKVTARRTLGLAVGLAACAGMVAAPAAAVQAKAKPSHRGSPPGSTRVVATGLDNPRQVAFGHGDELYVAEAGHGGSGACVASDDDPSVKVCYGTSGAIARVSHGQVRRVLTGLPSLAAQTPTQGGQLPPGAEATGPSDVSVSGRTLAFTVGLGSTPTNRFTFSATSNVGHLLGTAGEVTLPTPWRWAPAKTAQDVRQIGDLAAYEQVNNPVPPADEPDSNPNALLRDRRGYLVVDAGGNDLLSVSRSGSVGTVTTFPGPTKTCTPSIPSQAVPTSIVRGPGNAYYVGELTGFPFCEGGAVIWKVKHGHASIYASGLTNVTDLAFGPGGSLYAVEIAEHGLQSGPMGAVVKIPRGGGSHHSVVASGLMAPYGIAIRGNTAYVTTGSILPKSAGGGQVVAIALARHHR